MKPCQQSQVEVASSSSCERGFRFLENAKDLPTIRSTCGGNRNNNIAYGLERAMGELIHNPETMLKAKKELRETIGSCKLIEESDIDRLPYLQAVIKESLRLHPPAPLLLPRKARVDVQIAVYTIPKGAQIRINEWAIGRTNIWDDADLFSPERFLGSEIDIKGRHFNLTPFGSGRRICPGSPLAIRMMHSMLGSLINSFDWKLENDMEPKKMNLDKSLRAIPVELIKQSILSN